MNSRRYLGIRFVTLLLAVVVLYVRTPTSFTSPQFWGEDLDFFYLTRNEGWASLSTVMAGYLVIGQFVFALLARDISPTFIPAIYNYASIFTALSVVWLVTSPRLDLPSKPLLALAVVGVPMGFEELGNLANIQWLLPVGAFTLLFMRPASSPWALLGEGVYLLLTAVSGPFSIILTPLFLWRFLASRNREEQRRLIVLSGVALVGALTQIITILRHADEALDPLAPIPYPWTTWINLPFRQVMTTFGPASQLFTGRHGAILGIALAATALVLAFRKPFRNQKVFMILLAGGIAFSGMYKFRVALDTQYAANRYFYAGSIFIIWFIACLFTSKFPRRAVAFGIGVVLVALLPVIADTARIKEDLSWPVWASYIPSGLPFIVPTSPTGFYWKVPAAPDGRLSRFANWIGQDIGALGVAIDPAACSGFLKPVENRVITHPLTVGYQQGNTQLWGADGEAWNTVQNTPVDFIALTDANERVLGFGLPGFPQASAPDPVAHGSGWRAFFFAPTMRAVRAFGIVNQGNQACPLANSYGLPTTWQSLSTDKLMATATLTGGQRVTQRFKPLGSLGAISLRFVTYGHAPSQYALRWKVDADLQSESVTLGEGRLNAGAIKDWEQVDLPLKNLFKTTDQIEVSFSVDDGISPSSPIGLPLYEPKNGQSDPPVVIQGTPAPSGSQLNIFSAYVE